MRELKAGYKCIYEFYFKKLKNSGDTAQKLKFSFKNFFSKCDQMRRKLQIWSHLRKKILMGNFIFCTMRVMS